MRQHMSKYPLVYTAAVMFWLKTFIVQKFYFDLPVESVFQEFILLISPISSILLLLAVVFLVSKQRTNLSLIIVSFITSFILISNAVYYRFFHDFITFPTLFQTNNMGDLTGSVLGLIHVWDLWMFLDFLILIFLVYVKKMPRIVVGRKQVFRLFVAALVVFMLNWGMAEIVRPGMLFRAFDRQVLVKSIGAYNYHLHDAILNSKMKSKRVFARSTQLQEAEVYVEELNEESAPSKELYEAAEGKNIFVISMESIQDFVIGESVKGQEITPFLNELLLDSYYFPNFYHQTGQGKTSDAEFMVDTSLYSLPSGAVFFTHAQNTYNSTPKILKEHGYHSAVFHANDRTFWNRETMYGAMEYDQFFDKENYTITEENSVGWGLKDIDFFEQSMLHLKYLPQPFYSKFITLTNHHPYTIEEQDRMIPEFDSSDELVNRYFNTVRYMDESLKIFFQRLKEEGLYENSIFIMYGDHYGISEFHNQGLSEFIGKEITPFEQVQLQKVPMIIHIPGHEPKVVDTVSGQVDIRPTLLNLLGIKSENMVSFGHDMLSEDKESFVVLRDGSFITEEYIFSKNVCYLKSSGEEVEITGCAEYEERAQKDLQYSDEIIYGDLMRFSLDEAEETSEEEEVKEAEWIEVIEEVEKNEREAEAKAKAAKEANEAREIEKQ